MRLLPPATILTIAVTAALCLEPAAAQTPNSLAAPTLGFIPATNGSGLTPILGVPGAARLGATVGTPDGSTLYVAPRSSYLIAVTPGASLAIASLRPAALQSGLELTPVSGALLDPDVVVFSPTGSSAALYARHSNTVQVLSGLPNAPRVVRTTTVAVQLGLPAVSDDGQLLLSIEDGGAIVDVQSGATKYKGSPAGLAFLPGSHDAIVADSRSNAVLKLSGSGSQTVLSTAIVSPEALTVTSDGTTVILASARSKSLWAVPLVSGSAQSHPVEKSVRSLDPLPGGNTFLVTYQDGSHGLVSWRDHKLSSFFIGAFRDGVN